MQERVMAQAALEQRVSALEQEVEGEKLVTRHILEQSRRNGDDLAAMRAQLGRMEQRQDRADLEVRALRSDFSALRNDFGALRTEFGALRKELPAIVAETVREVLRERKR
jgi:chromosome segregation ATPase